LLFSAAYTGTALVLFWLSLVGTSTVYLPNLLVFLLVLGQGQAARRLSERYALDPVIHQAVILIGALSLPALHGRDEPKSQIEQIVGYERYCLEETSYTEPSQPCSTSPRAEPTMTTTIKGNG
jgi:hypothetical protein